MKFLNIQIAKKCNSCQQSQLVVVKGIDEFGFERTLVRCRYCGKSATDGKGTFIHYAGAIAERTIEYLLEISPLTVESESNSNETGIL
jgi:transposase-like protein